LDKTSWQRIIVNNYALPSQPSLAQLTDQLLSYLGSTDAELRGSIAYPILEQWIDRAYYTHEELWDIATRLLQNLTVGIGEEGTDTIFLRSYSILALVDVISYDVQQLDLSPDQVRQIQEQVIVYLLAEKDLRGYETSKGWMHAVAHCGDLFWALAQHLFIAIPQQERILNAIAARISAPVAHVYLYDEDERLVRAVMALLQRNMLSITFFKQWLKLLTHPAGRIAFEEKVEQQSSVASSEAETCARHNVKHFLRSLYFQLLSPGFADLTFVNEKPPQANELLPLVEDALRHIRVWC
jgi:Protein of unknown function (DUF2785)